MTSVVIQNNDPLPPSVLGAAIPLASGLVNTGVAIDVACCCEPPPGCDPPTKWAVIDYTRGTTILAEGTCTAAAPRPPATGGTLDSFPDVWRTREYGFYDFPGPRHLGVFLWCPGDGAWHVVEQWQPTLNRCAESNWWSEHDLEGSYTDPCCGETFAEDTPEAPQEFFATTFVGGEDAEWTNMSNWTSPETSNPWEMKLPDETVDVTITGAVWGNAFGSAKCKTLTVSTDAIVGISIDVDETATIDGIIANPSENTFCDPAPEVVVSCGGAATVPKGQNRATLKSEVSIAFGDVAKGQFNGNALGATAQAPEISFFRADNYGSCIPLPGGELAATFDKGATITAYDCSNFGTVDGSAEFKHGARNEEDASVSGAAIFRNDSINRGTIGGLAEFYDGAVSDVPWPAQVPPDYTVGVKGEAKFYDTSKNTGMIVSDTRLYGYSRQEGTIAAYAFFYDNSCSSGSAYTSYPDPPPYCP